MITTHVAKNLWGDNLYFGHRALADLLGHETLTGLMFMAAIGRRPTDDEREVFDAVSVIMTSADGRIWPLKLGRLVSSYGGTLAGWCASLLTMEGPRLGPWTTGYSARELVELRAQVGAKIDDGEAVVAEARAFFDRKRRVVGLGVPLREHDERYVALEAWVRRTGRDTLPHWRLHVALAAHGKRVANLGTNILLGLAAVLLDLGYTPEQISALVTFVNQNVFAANALEAARQRSPEMLRLPDVCVSYVGPPARSSPRAVAERRRVEMEPVYTDDGLAGA
jgi:hypothetical protein